MQHPDQVFEAVGGLGANIEATNFVRFGYEFMARRLESRPSVSLPMLPGLTRFGYEFILAMNPLPEGLNP